MSRLKRIAKNQNGVPPLGGFWSKLLIIMALVQAGHGVLAVVDGCTGIEQVSKDLLKAIAPASGSRGQG